MVLGTEPASLESEGDTAGFCGVVGEAGGGCPAGGEPLSVSGLGGAAACVVLIAGGDSGCGGEKPAATGDCDVPAACCCGEGGEAARGTGVLAAEVTIGDAAAGRSGEVCRKGLLSCGCCCCSLTRSRGWIGCFSGCNGIVPVTPLRAEAMPEALLCPEGVVWRC